MLRAVIAVAGGALRGGGELAALQALTNALGTGFWLNTIVAVTHAGRGVDWQRLDCQSKGTLEVVHFAPHVI